MERMEERMKGTSAENALPKMFVGKMKTYISCIKVDYESSRIEDFWDIQLNVSGNRCLDDSFKDYVQVETMDGENKYFAEGYGLQDAKKGVIFESFPQVLHLQLKRFEYDINRDAMMKVNDRYEFPEIWDASPYLSESADRSESYTYQLHGVLVHSGDFNAGHYYAFLKPTADGYFYRFDDDRVTRATMKEALEENFGGDYAGMVNGSTGVRNPYTRTLSTKRSMSAYMLVYIRQSRVKEVLQDVAESDTPIHLSKQLNDERAAIERRKKDREEQHLYLPISVIDEENYKAYQGFDLTDWNANPEEPFAPKQYRTLRTSTIADLKQLLAEERKLVPEHCRLWVMVNRQNKTVRPDQPILETSDTIEAIYTRFGTKEKPFRLWLETAETIEDGKAVWPEYGASGASNAKILIFLKYFDVDAQSLMGMGHVYMHKHSKVAEIVPILTSLMGWSTRKKSVSSPVRSSPPRTSSSPQINGNTSRQNSISSSSVDTPAISLYEEIKSSMIEPMKPKSTLQAAEIQDGDIICFQRAISDAQITSLNNASLCSDANKFYDTLLNRILINFSPKNPSHPSPDQLQGNENFTLVLSKKDTYDKLALKVAEHLRVEASHLRFSTVNTTTGRVKAPLRRALNQNLWSILRPYPSSTYTNSTQRDDSLIYEVLEMSVTELESKKLLKLTFLSEGITKEETFDILVPKAGLVVDMLRGLQKKTGMSDETLQRIRVFEVQSSRILREYDHDNSVVPILEHAILYAEVENEEEKELGEGERMGYAYHYDKEPLKGHGVPFRFVVKEVTSSPFPYLPVRIIALIESKGERFADTKERISKRTGIKGKQLDKIKFNVIGNSRFARPDPVEDGKPLTSRPLPISFEPTALPQVG